MSPSVPSTRSRSTHEPSVQASDGGARAEALQRVAQGAPVLWSVAAVQDDRDGDAGSGEAASHEAAQHARLEPSEIGAEREQRVVLAVRLAPQGGGEGVVGPAPHVEQAGGPVATCDGRHGGLGERQDLVAADARAADRVGSCVAPRAFRVADARLGIGPGVEREARLESNEARQGEAALRDRLGHEVAARDERHAAVLDVGDDAGTERADAKRLDRALKRGDPCGADDAPRRRLDAEPPGSAAVDVDGALGADVLANAVTGPPGEAARVLDGPDVVDGELTVDAVEDGRAHVGWVGHEGPPCRLGPS